MKDELIINLAPVPGEKQEEKYPGRLDVAAEAIQCEAAGAAIVHLHARDENHLQSVDPTLFAPPAGEANPRGLPHDYRRLDRRRAGTHVGPTLRYFHRARSRAGLAHPRLDQHVRRRLPAPSRRHPLLRPQAPGTRHHPDHAGLRPLPLVNFQRLLEDGETSRPCVFEFVFDVPNALPYTDRYLDLFVGHLPPEAIWFCVRHHQKARRICGE